MDASGSDVVFPLPQIIGIIACIAGSAFFSATETALTRIPDNFARQKIENEPTTAGLFKYWLAHKSHVVSSLLVGNNIVNILASVYAYQVAEYFCPDYASVVSVAFLTALILIFGEITPKTLAMQNWKRLSTPLIRIAFVFEKLFFIIARPLSQIPRLFTGEKPDLAPPVTEDEIEYQIRLGVQSQVFEETQQGELLRSAVEFPETLVKEVMTPRIQIFGIDVDTPFAEVVQKVLHDGHSRIPVYRESIDCVIGILHIRDLLEALAGGADHMPETVEPLVHEPYFAPETQKVSDLLALMKSQALHLAIVVDEFGGTAGLIALEDIIEELVGDIRDEYDDEAESPHLVKLEEGVWAVDARMSIYDLRDALGVMLPDTGEYESVGGYVVATCGAIPAVGTVVKAPGAQLKVLSADARKVDKCELRLVPEEQEPSSEEN